MPRGRRLYWPSLMVPRAPAAVSAAQKFACLVQALGPVDAPTCTRLWDALAHTAHPLGKRFHWFFVREEARPAAGFHLRLAAVLLAHRPPAWVAMNETLVTEALVSRQEGNALLECLLNLTSAGGEWK